MHGIGVKKQRIGVGIGHRRKKKHLHPKYAPVNRYARDIIGCLNNWVDGWVDWNMVLDKQGRTQLVQKLVCCSGTCGCKNR